MQICFSVEKKENANKDEYIPALQKSAQRAPSDAIHIVYFSGHGGIVTGKTIFTHQILLNNMKYQTD